MDTGPAVQGREIDIYMWNCGEALDFRAPVDCHQRAPWVEPEGVGAGLDCRRNPRPRAATPEATPQRPPPPP
jgi:hypothetical protein